MEQKEKRKINGRLKHESINNYIGHNSTEYIN